MPILSDLRGRYSGNIIPMQATLELTYKCNERCSHCYLTTYDDAADGRPPLSLDEWKRVLDELARAGTMFIVLIGGEAMMHPMFWKIAEHAIDRNFAVNLITNGLLINEAAAEKMATLGFYQVNISLYSAYPEIHDRMTRRKGSHARTVAAIERLRKNSVDVSINCLLTHENIETYFDLERWAQALGVRIQFDPMITPKSDASLDPTARRATPQQLKAFYLKLKAMGRGPVPAEAGEADDPVCNAGRGKCAINAYGDLLTCLEVRDPIGSLREHRFDELWLSSKAESLRGYVNRDLKFDSGCGDGAFCDHCPGVAGAETGDRMKAVPFLMELARIKREVFESR